MKFNKLTALLALGTLDLHSNIFGTKKPFAKLDEEQLQAIEEALVEKDVTALETKISELEAQVSVLTTDKDKVAEALNQALELNKLGLEEGTSMETAIVALGTKCKEYGDAKNAHSIPKTDGVEPKEDGLENGFFDATAEHNKI